MQHMLVLQQRCDIGHLIMPQAEEAEEQLSLSEAAIQHMLGEVGAAVNPGIAWAGASHWRYRTRAALRPAAAPEEEGTASLPAKAPTKCAPAGCPVITRASLCVSIGVGDELLEDH